MVLLSCNNYFHSAFNRFNKAKAIIGKSHLFEIINFFRDDNLKVLYNRCLAQMGLCAFRNGKYEDCAKYLNPICQSGTLKLKDFLSQSYNKESDKFYVFDKEDKKRTIPFIMTLDIDEIECTYYIVAMQIELSNILQARLGKKPSSISSIHETFQKLLCSYEKQVISFFI